MFVVKNVVKYWCYTNLNNTTFYYVDENTRSQLYSKSAPAATSVDEFSGTSYILVSADESILTLENNKTGESVEFERYSSGDLISTETLKTYALTRRYVKHKVGDFFKGNYTVVGSPTITNDGIASGFSASNYLELSKNFDVSGGKTWEMGFKIKTGNDVTTCNSICGHTGSSNRDPVDFCVKNGKFVTSLANSTSASIGENVFGTYNVQKNSTYYVKLTFNGSSYVASYSLDGKTYTEDIRKDSTNSIYTSNIVIGRQQGADSEYPFLGSIDLSQSYIKINGEYWWTGFHTKNVIEDKYYIPLMKSEKYYKEVSTETTITPKYKCYFNEYNIGFYYNVVDGLLYLSKVLGATPTTENDLIEYSDYHNGASYTINYLDESTLKFTATSTMTATRSIANDFGSYTITTTTVIPGTPDDYTYKEETLKYY